MSDVYKCECGQIVRSKNQPKDINWSDGHICILIKEKENE